MNRIWQRHWPPGLDEARIRLPGEPLTAFLTGHAARTPRKPAIVFYGRPISFAELDDASDRFAGWLRARGIGPGDRVALYLENCPQFAIAHFGALKAGASATVTRSVNLAVSPGRYTFAARANVTGAIAEVGHAWAPAKDLGKKTNGDPTLSVTERLPLPAAFVVFVNVTLSV